MEHGKAYAIFDQSDLYELVPKPALQVFNLIKEQPQLEQWTIWG